MDNCHGFFSLLCLGRAATVQTYHPTKNCRFFSFLSPVFGEQPPKHAVDEGSEESIVQRPNGQVRSFRGPPSRPSFSTGPWSSCIVTGHDRLMTVTSRPENNACAYYCMPELAVDLLVQQATACGLPEVFLCFTSRSIAIDRARRSARGASNMPAIDRKCFDCKQTTSHGLVLRMYASQ